jgi:proline racemase
VTAPSARTLSVIDYHTEGEPMRIVVGGVDAVPGATLMARS